MEEETESVSVSPKLMTRDEGWDIYVGGENEQFI